MGHLINPISFRLGYSRNWGFSGALMESKSQYFYLNSKYYGLLLFFKRVFSLQIFEKMGVLFSHLRFISSYNSDIIVIYLYDGPLQNESFIFYKYLNKLKKLKKILKFSKKIFKIFMRRTFFLFYYLRTLNLIFITMNNFLIDLLNYKIIKFMYIIAFIKLNLKIIDNIYFLKSIFFKINNFKKNVINFIFKNKINNFFYTCFIFDYMINFYFKNKNEYLFLKIKLIFISKIINILLYYYYSYNVNFFIKFYNYFSSNGKFFFNNVLFNSKNYNNKFLKNIIIEYSVECSYIENVINFFQLKYTLLNVIKFFIIDFIRLFILQRLKFFEFCKKFLFLLINGRKKKFVFLNFFFKFLSFFTMDFFIFLKNIIFLFKPFFFNTFSPKSFIYFKNISKKDITAALITKYICIRLKQKFSLKEVIRPILKDLTTNSAIQGFRLSCCGRFTKKEIATYRWERRGHTSLNTIDAYIDYSFNFVILKYSVCGIKIWLHKNSNYKYFFRKWFENFKFFSKKKKNKRKKFMYKKKKLKLKQSSIKKKIINPNKKKYSINIFYKRLNKIILKKHIKPFLIKL
jgi:hypothetical protein